MFCEYSDQAAVRTLVSKGMNVKQSKPMQKDEGQNTQLERYFSDLKLYKGLLNNQVSKNCWTHSVR